MLVALNAKESVDWDRLRISVCCFSFASEMARSDGSGQGTCLSSRKAREPVKRKAVYESRSTSTYESQRKTTGDFPCTKATLDFYILAYKSYTI